MKKRVLAIVMIFTLMLTVMTACSSDTQDKINQIKDDFNTLVTDVAGLSVDLVTAALSGVDITAIMDQLKEVTDFISGFVMSTLDEASSAVLDGIISQIQGMANILTNLKDQLGGLLGGLGGGDVGTENAQAILSEVAEVKATLNEVKTILQNMSEVPAA